MVASIHDPFADAGNLFAVPGAGGNGVEAPVDEHAKSCLAPPRHTRVVLRRRFRCPGRLLRDADRPCCSARQQPGQTMVTVAANVIDSKVVQNLTVFNVGSLGWTTRCLLVPSSILKRSSTSSTLFVEIHHLRSLRNQGSQGLPSHIASTMPLPSTTVYMRSTAGNFSVTFVPEGQ